MNGQKCDPLIWLYTHCKAIGMSEHSESMQMEHDIALFTTRQKDEIRRLRAEKEVYRKHWLDLCDRILAEIDKDGWCRLSMTKEEAMKMKSIFESLA